MKKYIITEAQVANLAAYLAKRPYEEVVQGIAGLQQLPELNEPPADEECTAR